MKYNLSYLLFTLGLLLVCSCTKENIDESIDQEDEVEVVIISCDLTLDIATTVNGSQSILTAIVAGGMEPYSYEWSTGVAGQTIEITADGNYEVTVTDNEGCVITGITEVDSSSDPCLDLSATILNNPGNNQLNVAATGGTEPYVYLWSTGETTETILVEFNVEYSITLTDANGCTTSSLFTVDESGDCSDFIGEIEYYPAAADMFVNFTGGTAPFSYNWSNGATTEHIGVSDDGIYFVTVTDSQGCELITNYTVDNSSPCDGFMGIIEVDSMNNSVTVTVIGGIAPYAFLWSNGETTGTIPYPDSGTYTVTVTDSQGCTILLFLDLGLEACAGFDMEFSYDADAQELTAIPIGGTPPYNFNWSTVENTQTISVESGVGYNSSIMDAEGCFAGGIFFVP